MNKIQEQIKQTMEEIKYFKHYLKCLKSNKKPTQTPPWKEEDAPKLPSTEAQTERKINQLKDKKKKIRN